MGVLDDIWEGDRLGRRSEARLLETFLISENEMLLKRGQKQSYVLGLDAPYGQGKSWFLDRLAKQLALNHPVARVDAWVDDTNDQPLVALMASVEDAIRPHLKERSARETLTSARHALLPILAKGATAFAAKAASKYLGENIGEEMAEIIQTHDGSVIEEAVDAAGDALAEGIDAIVDRAAEKMLADYRKRKQSADTFKERLGRVVQSLTKEGSKAPLFIIIDELDRCRPSYAIKMLEEIKHVFDVPGLVFIIALHETQLQWSVKVLYGEHFDVNEYLKRFFSRKYKLRALSVAELGAQLFREQGVSGDKLSYPHFFHASKFELHSPDILTGLLLAYWKVPPRKTFAAVDALRIFVDQWKEPVKIELTYLVRCIVDWLDVEIDFTPPMISLNFSFTSHQLNNPRIATAKELHDSMWQWMHEPLFNRPTSQLNEADDYVHGFMTEEKRLIFQNQPQMRDVFSILRTYASRIEEIGQLIDRGEDEA